MRKEQAKFEVNVSPTSLISADGKETLLSYSSSFVGGVYKKTSL